MTAPAIAFPDAAGEAAWRAAVARVLKGEDADARLVGRTLDGIAVDAALSRRRTRGPAAVRRAPALYRQRRISTPTRRVARSTTWRTAPTASS